MAKILSATDIIAANDLPFERVQVKQWKGDVLIRRLSLAEGEEFEKFATGKTGAEIMAKLLSICLVDESGNRLFKPEQVAALGGKSLAVMKQLYIKAQKINALDEDELKAAEKN